MGHILHIKEKIWGIFVGFVSKLRKSDFDARLVETRKLRDFRQKDYTVKSQEKVWTQ